MFASAAIPAIQILPLQVARGQLHVGAKSSGLEFLAALTNLWINRNRARQCIEQGFFFLLENHSNGCECIRNYGGLLGVRDTFLA